MKEILIEELIINDNAYPRNKNKKKKIERFKLARTEITSISN